jgi:hypothetical protein
MFVFQLVFIAFPHPYKFTRLASPQFVQRMVLLRAWWSRTNNFCALGINFGLELFRYDSTACKNLNPLRVYKLTSFGCSKGLAS